MKLKTYTIQHMNEKTSYDLPNGEIHIWLFSLADYSAIIGQKNALSETELVRADSFAHEEDQKRYKLGHICLRLLCSAYLNAPADSFTFSFGEHGKPALEGSFPLHFNLSHSGEMVALAFSMCSPVGIDIEHPRENIKYIRLARRHFHPKENELLEQADPSMMQQIFYRYWTLKEAYVKAIGSGLSIETRDFCILPDKEQAGLYHCDDIELAKVPAPDGYLCSVAYYKK